MRSSSKNTLIYNVLRVPVLVVYLIGMIMAIRYQAHIFARIGMVVGIVVPILSYAIKKKEKKNKTVVFFVFYLVLILYFVFHMMGGRTVYKYVATDRIKEMVFNLGWGFFTYLYFRSFSKQSLIRLYTLLCIALTVIQIVETGGAFRTVLTPVNINTLGLLCGYCAAFQVYQVLTNKSKMVNLLCLIFFAIIVLFTGSRQAMIAMALPTIILLVYQRKGNRFFRILIACLAIVVVYLMLMEIPLLYDLIGNRIETLFRALGGDANAEVSAAARERHYERALLLFARRPVMGYGLGNYQYLAGTSVYSHSNYMEMLVSGGCIAFLLYYIPFIVILIRTLKIKVKTPFLVLLIGLLCTQIFIECFLISYYRHFTMLIYVILIALLDMEKSGVPYTTR